MKAISPLTPTLALTHLLHAALILAAAGQPTGDGGGDCDGGKGECKRLIECPPIAEQFQDIFEHIQFCDEARNVVCCPKKTKLTRRPFVEDTSRTFVNECRRYRDRVYPKCGPLPLIVNGERAAPRELPHMALLGVDHDDGRVSWICGGTLISPKYVLSAAHCFFDEMMPNRVRLGELDYSTTSDVAQPQDFLIQSNVTHPDYDFQKNYNDIVLVQLDREATLNEFVAPACLPLSNGSDFPHMTAAGWGAVGTAKRPSTHLLKVQLEVFDDADCRDFIELPDKLEHGVHLRTQFCVGSHTDERDTCQGDSGGPLFVQHPLFPCMYLLLGITSFGFGCGAPDAPGVYVRVNAYVDWIERIVWGAGVF